MLCTLAVNINKQIHRLYNCDTLCLLHYNMAVLALDVSHNTFICGTYSGHSQSALTLTVKSVPIDVLKLANLKENIYFYISLN